MRVALMDMHCSTYNAIGSAYRTQSPREVSELQVRSHIATSSNVEVEGWRKHTYNPVPQIS